MTDERKRFERLVTLMEERALTNDEVKQLNLFIRNDDALAREYVDHCQMTAMLLETRSGLPPLPDLIRARTARSPVSAIAPWAALAACVVVGVALFFVQRKGPPLARVAKTLDCEIVVVDSGTSLRDGGVLREGSFVVKTGVVELVAASNARLIVEAPAAFELMGSNEINLHNGKIYVSTNDASAKTFTVHVGDVSFMDMGTEFAVEGIPHKQAKLFVFKGKVRVFGKLLKEDQTIDAGDGLIIDASTGVAKRTLVRLDLFTRKVTVPETPYAQALLKYRPVVYYPMDINKAGDLLVDYSGFNDVSGVPLANVNQRLEPGRVGSACRFTDTPIHVKDYPKAASAFTVMAWVRAEAVQEGTIANHGRKRGQFLFGLEKGTGCLKGTMHDALGRAISVVDIKRLTVDTWHFVAMVYDGNVLFIYRDGNQVAYAKGVSNGVYQNNLSPEMTIGATVDGGEVWRGLIDEFAVFNRAFTLEELNRIRDLARAR